MGSKRRNEPHQLRHGLAIVLTILAPLIGMSGCRPATTTTTSSKPSQSASPDSSQHTNQHSGSGQAAPIDWFVKARRQFELGQHEEAAKSIGKVLIEAPDRADVIFLAARIAQARKAHAESAELASLVPLTNARFGRQAMELRVDQLIRADQSEAAIKLLYDVIGDQPDHAQWRHLLWQELNRQGRRQEASLQADQLCRQGLASPEEVQSLIGRNDAFPLRLKNESSYVSQFAPGLGHARWHYSLGNYQKGLEALKDQWESNFSSAAASAMYGRLLAETQDFDRLKQWHKRTDDEVRQFSDYWVAVGAALLSAGQHEAAARALLEAVARDSTDRITYQRLSQTMTALGRTEDAEQMLMLSNQVGTSQQLFIQIQQAPQNRELWQQQAQGLTQMGRPLEAIGWYTYSLPPGATAQLAKLQQHREELLAMGELDQLQSDVALAAIDLEQFQLQPALDETLATASPDTSSNAANSVKATPFSAVAATPRLNDVAAAVGLDFQWYHDAEINLDRLSLYESLGGGIAVIDFDLDGWPDVYLAQGSAAPPEMIATRSNQLMRNSQFSFRDVAQSAGATDLHYTQGLAAGDVNQDGFPDLFLAAIGTNRLLINNGDGTFSDATSRLGDAVPRFSTSVAIADVTGDSLPDLIEANYIAWENALEQPRKEPDGSYEIPGPIMHPAESDACYQNLGDGRWTRVELNDESSEPGSGLGLLITDLDENPGNEIFVANDARPNHLWMRTRDGQWINSANRWGIAHGYEGLATAAMGIAAGDFNRDGRIDLHVTNFFNEPSNLYLNAGDNLFSDLAVAWQLDRATRPMVGFGTKAIDFDRNGWLDLIISNGHVFDRLPPDQTFKMPPQLMMSHGDHFEQVNVDDPSGYFAGSYLGRAMAVGDFDRDHRLDLLIGHLDRPLALLKNETSTEGKWLQLQLVGTESERDAVGATVTVRSGNLTWREWITAGDGYYCSDQPLLELALGDIERVDQVEVLWPSGKITTIASVETNVRYLCVESDSALFTLSR